MPSKSSPDAPNDKPATVDSRTRTATELGNFGLTDLAVNQTVTLPSARVPAEPPKRKSNNPRKGPAAEPRK